MCGEMTTQKKAEQMSPRENVYVFTKDSCTRGPEPLFLGK